MEHLLTPYEIYTNMIQTSVKKANTPFIKSLFLGIMAGIFIALAAIGAISIWGMNGDISIKKFLGAAVFPVGIVFVVIAGSELFTGNALMAVALLNKKISLSKLLKNWTAVYLGNFIGSVFIAFLMYKSGIWIQDGTLNSMGEFSVSVGNNKVALDFMTAFYRGILCNIIVVLAVWTASATNSMIGKIGALWLPVTVFALSGYEHCVANMFFIPVAMFHSTNITIVNLFQNLIPVTLGNIVGGAIVVPIIYFIIHSKK